MADPVYEVITKDGEETDRERVRVQKTEQVEVVTVHTLWQTDGEISKCDMKTLDAQTEKMRLEAERIKIKEEALKVTLKKSL